jgi:hypothetical protein
VTGDALGVQRACQAAVHNVELRLVVHPKDVEPICNRQGTASLSDAAGVAGVVGQMVLDVGDGLAGAILAKGTRVVDVVGAYHASRGRGARPVHRHDERVHLCVGGD